MLHQIAKIKTSEICRPFFREIKCPRKLIAYLRDVKTTNNTTATFSLALHAMSKSNETYDQTRGLSNLEMKHVGELAINCALFKAIKTSRVSYYASWHVSYKA